MKTEKRKNIVTAIVLSVAVLISLTFIIYAKIKVTEAEKNAKEAVRQSDLAQTESQRADLMQQRALEAATEAVTAQAEAARIMKQLEECQSK